MLSPYIFGSILKACDGIFLTITKFPGYDTKQSDGEVSVMLELWEMQIILSLPMLPDPLWYYLVAPDKVLSMGQTELNHVLMLN